jgi:hypothetical protein
MAAWKDRAEKGLKKKSVVMLTREQRTCGCVIKVKKIK